MADFPGAIFDPRTLENVPGHDFDATKTQRIYAEDFNLPDAEIVAIETTLGTDPQGTFDTVKAWLEWLTSNIGAAIAFLDLTDVPASYSGEAGKLVAVKGDETGLEFIDAPAGGGTDLFDIASFTLGGQAAPAAGWGSAVVGSGRVIDVGDQSIYIDTQSTANSKARAYSQIFLSAAYHNTGYNKNIKVRVMGNFNWDQTGCKSLIYFGDNTDASAMTKYMGIRLEAGVLKFVTKDGTTEQATTITTFMYNQPNMTYDQVWDFIHVPGVADYCYINGVLAATHSTHPLPNASTGSNYLSLYCDNGATTNEAGFILNGYYGQKGM